ncbi:MAG: DUF4157 domain-containing protein [Thiotrichales bacterium]
MKLSVIQAASATSRFTPARVQPLLQRKCACGAQASTLSGECEECRQRALGVQTQLAISQPGDPWEREADQVAARVTQLSDADIAHRAPRQLQRLGDGPVAGIRAPGVVERVLHQSGQTLEPTTRAFFEPRLGYDLSRVRVHRDPAAAASARAVNAHAYTVGQHVVFGTGQYAPATSRGRALLAHELTHVIQQRGALQRHAITSEPDARMTPDEDDEHLPAATPESVHADEESGGISALPRGLRLQRQVGDEIEESSWPEKDEAARIRAEAEAQQACVAATGPDPAECTPDRALTWADFSGRVPRRSRFGAATASDLRERDMNVALLRCMPNSAAAATAPGRGIQAFLNASRSWVKAQSARAGDPAANGCNTRIRTCERHFDRLTRRGQTGTYSLASAADTGCPASVTARGDVANNRAECRTVVGADCTDRAVAESARLLQHEQGHFDLTCKMATKANGLLASAPSLATLLTNARTVLRTQQANYDRDSAHGCNAGGQASWETDIAAGLPNVTIPLTAPARRRRRGRGSRRRGR